MKAKTSHKMTKEEFSILKTTMKNMSDTYHEKKKNKAYYSELPKYVGIKITNACNLRCKHCYQWNETGYHRYIDENRQHDELSLEIIEKILKETENEKSRMYVWGGEPFVYKNFGKLLSLLKEYGRETSICTNAILADRYVDELAGIEKLELLVGLEGPEIIHDSIRGKGTFKKVFDSLDVILEKKHKGIFKGKISVHTMVSDELRNCLYDYLCFLEKKGIDMVIICFPWFISDRCKKEMDVYYKNNCAFLPQYSNSTRPSWYSFNYNFKEEYVDELIRQFEIINKRAWNMVIRYQPNLNSSQVRDFIAGNNVNMNRQCLALAERIDINPDATASACKFFDEFVMGSLKEQTLTEIWNSEAYQEFRKLVSEKLMPVCSTCSVLHLHGMEGNYE